MSLHTLPSGTGYGVSFMCDLQTNDHIKGALNQSVVTLVIMLTQYIPRSIDTIDLVLYFIAVRHRPVSPIFFWVSLLALRQAWHCHSANEAALKTMVEKLHEFGKVYNITKNKIHQCHVDISFFICSKGIPYWSFLLIGPLGTNFSEILIENLTFTKSFLSWQGGRPSPPM